MSARAAFLSIVGGILLLALAVRVADDVNRLQFLASGTYRVHYAESQPDSLRWQVSGNGVVATGSTLGEAIDEARK